MRVKTIFVTESINNLKIKNIQINVIEKGESKLLYDDMYCPQVKYVSYQM